MKDPQLLTKNEFIEMLNDAGYTDYTLYKGATWVAYVKDADGDFIELYPDSSGTFILVYESDYK